MKSKQLFSTVLILLFIGSQTPTTAQNYFKDSPIESTSFDFVPTDLDIRTYELHLEESFHYDTSSSPKSITAYEAQNDPIAYALNMIAFGAGFGFSPGETLWCIQAAYYLKLASLGNKALFGSLGAGYNYTNAEFLTFGALDITLRALMFSVLAKQFNQVRAQYGIFAKYAFGKNKYNDGFRNDFTTLSLGIMVGLHILLTSQWSMMVQTNLLTHQQQTTDSNGVKVSDNQTFGLINKANLLLLSLVFTLPNSRQR